MKRPLIFVGSRSAIIDVALIAELHGIEILGILDYHYYGNRSDVKGIPIIGDERWLLDENNTEAQQWLRTCDFFPLNWWNGAQGPESGSELVLEQLRIDRIEILERARANVINLIHPHARLPGLTSKYANYKLGKGILIQDGCWHSADNVEIGDYCAFSNDSMVGHDVKIGNNVIVNQYCCLHRCEIGDNSFLGLHTHIAALTKLSQINIGNNVTVWSETVVKKHIPANKMLTPDGRILSKRYPPRTYKE